MLLLGENRHGQGSHRAAPAHALRAARNTRLSASTARLAETPAESELFGHEGRAHQGRPQDRAVRTAEGGSLFLDEIGDISAATQVKPLRVLQERESYVGGTKTVACDVRIIAPRTATSPGHCGGWFPARTPRSALNVFPINLPPLRERREDIPQLVEHFVRVSAGDLGVKAPAVSAEAGAILAAHNWPGNIRELQNVVERMVLMCDGGEILPMHLPREIADSATAGTVRAATADGATGDGATGAPQGLRGYERALIVQALSNHGWNQTRAAEALGISRDNLRYRVKKYKITRPKG
ncbi:MAG: sigma-54-dependent Fis family transcriptional regulator [Phycisphaerales bacterium]|nr:sigma-54-dependent Fis family transcriptional regulator [Phycisphaerales bacterium]